MNCPIDNTPLAIAERQGIEIDYCPTCRGVWLDRGELDKLIERNAQYNANYGVRDEDGVEPTHFPPAASGSNPPQPQQPSYPQQPPVRGAGADIAGAALDLIQKGLNKRREASHSSGYAGQRKKKGGLLGELFDF